MPPASNGLLRKGEYSFTSPGTTVGLVVNGDVSHPDDPFLSRDIVTAGAGIDLAVREDLRVSIDYDANFYTGNGLDQVLRLEGRLAL